VVKSFLSVLLIVLIAASSAQADFYKWEDEDGNIHITDYPPPSKSAKKIKVHETDSNADRTPAASSQKAAPASRASSAIDRPKQKAAHEVTLYTTSWCPYCKKAKAFFDARGIPYTEYDVEKDSAAAQRKKELSGAGGVPFAIVNGESISGFSPARYEAALKKNE